MRTWYSFLYDARGGLSLLIMKFIILTKYGSYIVECEDFEAAIHEAYNSSTGYDNVMAIVRIEEI